MRTLSESDKRFIKTELFDKGSRGLALREIQMVLFIAMVTNSTCEDIAEKFREAGSACAAAYNKQVTG